jgi:hypothetical protein
MIGRLDSEWEPEEFSVCSASSLESRKLSTIADGSSSSLQSANHDQSFSSHDAHDSVPTNQISQRHNFHKQPNLAPPEVSSNSNHGQRKWRPPEDICGYKVVKHNNEYIIPELSQPVLQMEDSAHVFNSGDPRELWDVYNRQGYLLLRGVLDLSLVKAVNKDIRSFLTALNTSTRDPKGWTVEMVTGYRNQGSPYDYQINTEKSLERWKRLGELHSLQVILFTYSENLIKYHPV